MEESGKVIDVLDGWKVKQYHNKKVDRWYVTISQNSPLAALLGRHRLLRSHYAWMKANGTWEVPPGYVIHHKDHDRHNDAASNLEMMLATDHDRLHREFAAIYGGTSFKGRRHRPETIQRMREVAQARGNNGIWDSPKTHHFENTKQLMSKIATGANNPTFRADLIPEQITNYYLKTRSLKQTAEHFGCSVSAVRYRLDRSIYERRANPCSGRERKYQFDDGEMALFYEKNGARLAAEKYGWSEATIYYRYKRYKKDTVVN